VITTDRLLLRHWKNSDREPFSVLNADPNVMEFMPGTLSRDQSDALFDRIQSHFQSHGFGLFAAELRPEHAFIGYIGLAVPRFQSHFTPCVEIGWRLSAAYWNRSLATEGARAVLRYTFETLALEEIVSFTVPANVRSRRVMEKIGLIYSPSDDFDHPLLSEGHPLRRHVLYRLTRSAWTARLAPADPKNPSAAPPA
jgi:RimJ/RimL family protein N-acetyltransferase